MNTTTIRTFGFHCRFIRSVLRFLGLRSQFPANATFFVQKLHQRAVLGNGKRQPLSSLGVAQSHRRTVLRIDRQDQSVCTRGVRKNQAGDAVGIDRQTAAFLAVLI